MATKLSKMRMFNSVEDIYSALDEGVKINEKFSWSHPTKTNNKAITISLGRIWWNLLLPPSYKLVDEPVNQKLINNIVHDVVNSSTPEEASEFITRLNQETYKIGLYCPPTFSIDAVILPDKIKKDKEKLQKHGSEDPLEFNKEVKEISNELEETGIKEGKRFYDINKSGAKDAPVAGLLIGRGSISDIEGNVSKPLRTALTDGQNVESYYLAASEARRGFYYKAAISAKPGYLSRRVTMANAHIVIDENHKDCGTHTYFKITVTPDIAGIINHRYHMVNGRPKLIENSKELIGKTINLRSPLYCKSERGICPTCYGDSWKRLRTKNIGILAGGAVNDLALNAYMKMRHKSSVTEYVPINFVEDLTRFNLITPEFKRYILAQENKLIANDSLYISLDLNDYDELTLIESSEYYLVPGILNIFLTNDPTKYWSLPFTYQVKLNKPSDIEEDGKILVLRYSPGDVIMEQTVREKSADVSVMERLFEGQMKYINKPEMLTMSLLTFLGGLELNTVETVVQNMFRDTQDLSKPARLTDYSSFKIIGQKGLPLATSWVNAMSFENVSKALHTGLLTGADAPDDPMTKIVNEKYNNSDNEDK